MAAARSWGAGAHHQGAASSEGRRAGDYPFVSDTILRRLRRRQQVRFCKAFDRLCLRL